MRNLLTLRFLFLSCLVFVLAHCKREVPTSMNYSDKFIKVFSMPGAQIGQFIKATPDGGFVLFSNGHDQPGDLQTLVVRKLNATGMVEWQQVYSGDNLSGYFTPLNNGKTLFASGSGNAFLLLFDVDGKLEFNDHFSSLNNYEHSQPYQVENPNSLNGCFLLASCNGVYGGTNNYIWKRNPDGSFLDKISLQNFTDVNGKLLDFKVYAYQHPDTYYLVGQHFSKTNWQWIDCEQTFVAKIQYDSKLQSTKTVTLDPANLTYFTTGYSVGRQIAYPDNSLLIAVNQYYWANTKHRVHFFKVDADLNLSWEKDLILENSKECLVNSIVRCADGNLILSGWAVQNNQKIRQPFICKMDHQANVIWKQSFNSPYGGTANYATELSDGSIAFTGVTQSFGEGSTIGDVFLVKTDKNGNLK